MKEALATVKAFVTHPDVQRAFPASSELAAKALADLEKKLRALDKPAR